MLIHGDYYLSHCPAQAGWEGIITQLSQETCHLQPRSFTLSGRKAMIMILKKVKYYVYVCCWLSLQLSGSSNYIYAQELPPVVLEPVEIVNERLSPFAIGASTTSFDSTLIEL